MSEHHTVIMTPSRVSSGLVDSLLQAVSDTYVQYSGKMKTALLAIAKKTATWTWEGPSCWLASVRSSYSEQSWTHYLPRFIMHSRISSIMPRIYYLSSLAAYASHNPRSKSTVGCVRTRSYTHLERGLNEWNFTSQDREGLGRRWIFFRLPCAGRG
jgi:hypothetical protein